MVKKERPKTPIKDTILINLSSKIHTWAYKLNGSPPKIEDLKYSVKNRKNEIIKHFVTKKLELIL